MRKTILIVENDVIVRNALIRMLSDGIFEVLEAASPDEAFRLSRAWEGAIDLIIADFSLTTLGLRELWSKLQELRPDLKLLQISGYTTRRFEAEQGLMPGARFLRKPFSQKTLLNAVKRIFLHIEIGRSGSAT